MSGSDDELEKLKSKLEEVHGRLDLLRSEIKSCSEKRHSTLEELKALRGRIREVRDRRNAINKTVKLLKEDREELKSFLEKSKKKLVECEKKVKALYRRRPEGSIQKLEEQLEEIDWRIQTTPLPLNEEKRLVDKAREIGAKLGTLRKIKALEEEKRLLKGDMEKLRIKINLKSESVLKLADQSQKTHLEMLSLIEDAEKLRAMMESEYKRMAEAKEKHRILNEEYISIRDEWKRRLKEKKLREEEQRKETAKHLLKQLKKQASEKLKLGKRLSWEEFRLLSNEDEV